MWLPYLQRLLACGSAACCVSGKQLTDPHNPFAVAVLHEEGSIREIYPRDGLEVSIILTFSGEDKEVQKAKGLIEEL